MCDFLIYRAHHSCATKSNFGCHKTRGGKGERTTSSGASDGSNDLLLDMAPFGTVLFIRGREEPMISMTNSNANNSSSKHRDYTPKVLGVTSFRSVCFKKLFVKLYRRECLTGWRCRKWEGDEQISRQRVQSAPFEIWERGTPPLFFSLSRNRSNSTFRTCPWVDFRF